MGATRSRKKSSSAGVPAPVIASASRATPASEARSRLIDPSLVGTFTPSSHRPDALRTVLSGSSGARPYQEGNVGVRAMSERDDRGLGYSLHRPRGRERACLDEFTRVCTREFRVV